MSAPRACRPSRCSSPAARSSSTEQLAGWDAFVAAWLPGSEGAGVADVLFGDVAPTGKLPHSWPRSVEQVPINVGDADYDPLFPFGFGLSVWVGARRLAVLAALAPRSSAAATALSASRASTPVYKDASAPVDKRVADLLARMTLAEKVGQMTQVDRGFLAHAERHRELPAGLAAVRRRLACPTPNTPTAWADMTTASSARR